MDKKYAEFIINQTIKNYNKIAQDYTRTRSYLPEDIKKLSEYIQEGDKILDSGCANGRLAEALKNKKIDYYGIDSSEKLIKIAQEKYKNYSNITFQKANALELPFTDNFFDKVYSIAVIHHIPTEEFRLKYLQEIFRVLKPKGLLILRVWNLWKRKTGLKLILKYSFLKIIGKSNLDFKDIFLPWKDNQGNILINRYLHCFTKKEIIFLAKKTGFKIKNCWEAGKGVKANIYLIAEK